MYVRTLIIAGNFRGQNIRAAAIVVISWVYVLIGWCLRKGTCTCIGKVASFGGEIRGPVFNHENHEYFAPQKLLAIRYCI